MRSRSFRAQAALCSIFTLLLASAAVFGQDARGRITGRVLDPSGAPIPGASVEVTEASTGVKLGAKSNEAGSYELLYLMPGNYTLAVSSQGFKSYERTNVEVRVAERLTMDVTLAVGQVSESVTVTGEVPLIDTASASLGQITDKRRIIDLPLPGGNSLSLAQFAPGVVYLAAPNHPTLGVGAVDQVSNIAVNGTRSGSVEFTVDGAPSMAGTTVSFSPPTEMVSEVKVQTATYDAGIGRVPGGNVNIVLRTGANQFHGVAQWFHTNQHLQGLGLFSRQFLYNPATGPVDDAKKQQVNPLNILNRYGVTVSGPVTLPKVYDGRNRTFWVFSGEGLNRPQIMLGTPYSVPTASQQRGDFSELLRIGSNYQIYDPATTTPVVGGRYSRQPFPGNIIPTARLDKTATGLLQYWNQPNVAGTADGVNNHVPLQTQVNRQKNLVAKVDHNFNEAHRSFVRYNFASQFYVGNSTGNITRVADRYRRSQGAVVDDVWVISPSLLTNARIGFTRFAESNTPELTGFDLTKAGFSPSLQAGIDPRAHQFPNLSVAGYQQLGGATNNNSASNYLTASDDVTWSRGSVLFRFGGEFWLYRANSYALGGQNPSMTFNQRWTNGPLDTAAAAPIGQGLASFLLGLPSTGSISLSDSYADQSYNYAFYAQSDWRITRTLTLNAGLRYDYEGPITERFDRSVRGFDFGDGQPARAASHGQLCAQPHGGTSRRAVSRERRPHVCRRERAVARASGIPPGGISPRVSAWRGRCNLTP